MDVQSIAIKAISEANYSPANLEDADFDYDNSIFMGCAQCLVEPTLFDPVCEEAWIDLTENHMDRWIQVIKTAASEVGASDKWVKVAEYIVENGY